MAGLSRFGSAGCLTELGIVHQGVAHREKTDCAEELQKKQ